MEALFNNKHIVSPRIKRSSKDMEITEVRIFPRSAEDKKLRAFATITFDNCFVVRNIKIIEGTKGLFVAMPSRKVKESCPKCGFKNPARVKFCGQCAASMPQGAPVIENSDDRNQRQSEHRDIAHPVTAECRDQIQKKVLEAYKSQEAHTVSQPRAYSEKPVPGTEPFGSGDIDLG
jgi:stage V sporulation protein G